jgi:hypothetical protein
MLPLERGFVNEVFGPLAAEPRPLNPATPRCNKNLIFPRK